MTSDIFGAVKMGYALIESQKLDEWTRFLKDGMGLHLAQSDATSQAFRMDAHARRLIIDKGPAEDFVALGWQVRDADTLDIILARLKARNIAVRAGSADEAAHRGVEAFWAVKGPKGLGIELFVDASISSEPMDMLTSAFVTGDGGLGHVAITSRKPQQMRRFYEQLFDARFSDHIVQQMAGVTLDIDFLRLNERHHSVAIATVRGLALDPIRTRVQHLNLQAATVDDLTGAYVRLKEMGVEMAHEMGQHPNDGELSFYALTPSGFEMELGWNPLVVDEANWQTREYQGMSSWGHQPGSPSPMHNLGNFGNGLRSLLKPEFSPID